MDRVGVGRYGAEPVRRRGGLSGPRAEARLASSFAKYEPAMARLGKALRAKLRARLPGLFEIVDVYENQDALVTLVVNLDVMLAREIFYSLREVQVLVGRWREECNRFRPHSSLGDRPPAPEAVETGMIARSA